MFLYLYAQTSTTIHQLKMEARKIQIEERRHYVHAGTGQPWVLYVREHGPSTDWIITTEKIEHVVAHMSPRHERWRDYRNAKRRATLLLAARLILKANNGIVPAKEEMSPFIRLGIFRSHARTASAQKALALSAYRYLHKLDNRLRKQPDRFAAVEAWIKER